MADVASGLAVISALCAGFSLIAAWAETYLRIACLQTPCHSIRSFPSSLGALSQPLSVPGQFAPDSWNSNNECPRACCAPNGPPPLPQQRHQLATDPGPLPDSLFCPSAPSYSRQGDGVSCSSSRFGAAPFHRGTAVSQELPEFHHLLAGVGTAWGPGSSEARQPGEPDTASCNQTPYPHYKG